MSTLQRYDRDGLELVIDTQSGEAFATVSGYARMSGKAKSTISDRTVRSGGLKTAEVQTTTGSKTVRLIPESIISDWIIDDNPKLAKQMLKAGVRVFLYGVAGYQVKPSDPQPTPQPQLELPPTDIRIDNLARNLQYFGIDITNPRFNQEIKDLVTDKILMAESGNTPKETWLGVAEKAERMGYPVALVTRFRSSLGKWVAKHSDELDSRTESRLCNGTQRPIKLYRDCQEFTDTIREYMDVKVLAS